jgi:hypothetical protein
MPQHACSAHWQHLLHVDPTTLTCLKLPALWTAWAAKISSSIPQQHPCGAAGASTCVPSYNSRTQLLQQHRAEAKLRRLHAALCSTAEDTNITLIQALQHAVLKLASFCKRHGAAATATLLNQLQQVQPAAAVAATTAADRYGDTLLIFVLVPAAKFIARNEYQVSKTGFASISC